MHLWSLNLGIRQMPGSLMTASCDWPHRTLLRSRSLTALTCMAHIYVVYTMSASPWLLGPSEACRAQAGPQIPPSCRGVESLKSFLRLQLDLLTAHSHWKQLPSGFSRIKDPRCLLLHISQPPLPAPLRQGTMDSSSSSFRENICHFVC